MQILFTLLTMCLVIGAVTWSGVFDTTTLHAPSELPNETIEQATPTIISSTGKAKEVIKSVESKSPFTLDLSDQNLTKVSNSVFDQKELTTLNLSNNLLSGSLQAEVRHLENLKNLDLSNNLFTGVPAEIGQLRDLEVLNLSNNQLTGLPSERGNLSNLKILNLSGNNYSTADLATIKEKLPVTTTIITQ